DKNKANAIYIRARVKELRKEQNKKARVAHVLSLAEKTNITRKRILIIIGCLSGLPLFLRPPEGGFPGFAVAPLQILFSWAALFLFFTLIGAILALPFYLLLWAYAGRDRISYDRFIVLGAIFYTTIELFS